MPHEEARAHTEGRLRGDTGRGWNYVATNQGKTKIASKPPEAGEEA